MQGPLQKVIQDWRSLYLEELQFFKELMKSLYLLLTTLLSAKRKALPTMSPAAYKSTPLSKPSALPECSSDLLQVRKTVPRTHKSQAFQEVSDSPSWMYAIR
jgi:hypothetical protein